LVARILHRAKTSGRADDNEETLKNRIANFVASTTPTINLYNTFGKVYPIDACGGINEIFAATKEALLPNIIYLYGPPIGQNRQLAEFLQDRLQYKLIVNYKLYKANNLDNASDDKKINFMINYL